MATKLPTEANVSIEDAKTFFDYISEASGGKFFNGILFGIMVILFMLFRGGTSNGKAFVGSTFICMLMSILLRTLGWVSNGIMYTFILLTGVGVVWAYLEDRFD